MIHGLRSTYVNEECRCELCKAANRDYYRRYRAGERVAREPKEVIRVPKPGPNRFHDDWVGMGLDEPDTFTLEEYRRVQGIA